MLWEMSSSMDVFLICLALSLRESAIMITECNKKEDNTGQGKRDINELDSKYGLSSPSILNTSPHPFWTQVLMSILVKKEVRLILFGQ